MTLTLTASLQSLIYSCPTQQYWANALEPYQYVPVGEFAERFKKFHVGRAISDHLALPPHMSAVATRGHRRQDEVSLHRPVIAFAAFGHTLVFCRQSTRAVICTNSGLWYAY